MKDIHVVILVVGIQNRFDRATVHTIQYYKALFHPVFMHGDVFLALPNFGQRRLEEIIEEADEDEEVEASIASYLDVYKKECEVCFVGGVVGEKRKEEKEKRKEKRYEKGNIPSFSN